MPEAPLVLVTGATGFVGRHLCPELIARGFRVRAAFRGEGHLDLPGVSWVRVGDVGPSTDWTEALHGVSHVIHLASLAHQVGEEGEAIRQRFRQINVEGTRRLAEAAAIARLPGRFCFVSSIGAVTTFSEVPVSENTPCAPDSDYGRSKLEAEEAVKEVLGQAGVSWTIVRPTLVYGPGNPGNMARLLRLIRTGLPLPLSGIQNRRSFVFVSNLADALIHALGHPAAEGKALLVHDGRAISTPELLRMLGKASGRRVRLFPCPMALLHALARAGDLVHWIAGRSIGLDTYSVDRLTGSLAVDSEAVYAELGWKPPVSMEEGLCRTFAAEAGKEPMA